MTMHLEGPWLSTSGKKKGKTKFASAEAKRKYEQLQQDWDQLKRKHGVQEAPRSKSKPKVEPLVYKLDAPAGRGSTRNIPSLGATGGNATRAEPKVYTGDKIIGVATLHKSVAVPVFSQEEAIDISKMRR